MSRNEFGNFRGGWYARVVFRGLEFCAVLLGALSVAHGASASEADTCIDAAEAGQKDAKDGKLRAARRAFLECARDACPAAVRTECTKWLDDVDARQPAVLFRVRNSEGREITDVQISADGAPFLTTIDGRAQMIDPGVHEFIFETHGVAWKESVLIRERDKSALVDATVPKSLAAEKASRPVASASVAPPLASILLGGVGLVGVGGFALFGTNAVNGRDDLRNTCAPFCTDDQVSAVKRDTIIANVSLGVGVVALIAGTVIWIKSANESHGEVAR